MQDIINTLLVSFVPAVLTSVITYLVASKKAKTQILSLQESNRHEMEKLIRQHEVDIESLKEKYQLEFEKSEQEHNHRIELMELEHKNALESNEKEQSNAAMFSVMSDVLTDPNKFQSILKLANNPMFRKD